MKLIVAGGGTGGHLFPGIAVAEEFLSRSPDNEVLFVGSEKGIESRTIPRLGYRLELISAAGVKGKGTLSKLKAIAMMLYGYSQSRRILKQYRPDMVLGVGGYASLPTVMAAKGMEIPCFVHEQNALPGLSNRLLSRVATKVFISLGESLKYFPAGKTLLTGNPLRRQIVENLGARISAQGANTPCPEERLAPFDKEEIVREFRLFIFGGSQGARPLNQALPKAITLMKERFDRLKVVHQTGEADLDTVQSAYQQAGFDADVRAFIDDMAAEYAMADLIVCRAGATTIAEITACGKACLFIPFPHAADDHQRKNAEALLKKGACEVMLEMEMNPESLASAIIHLMDNREELARIGENARGLARLEAAQVIVDEMLKGLEPCTER